MACLQVLGSGSAAPTMLCCVSLGYEIETFSLVKVLSSFLPFPQVIFYLGQDASMLDHLSHTDIRRILTT